MRTRILFALWMIPALCAGCGSFSDRYVYSRTFERPREEIIKGALDTLDSENEKLEKADMEKGVFECKWKEMLHDFRYEGYRTKTFAKVETEKGSPGFKVGFMVRKQRNDAMTNPSDPANAEWSDIGFDDDAESALLYKFLGKFEPLAISDDYERRMKERAETGAEIDRMFENAKVDDQGHAHLNLVPKKKPGTDEAEKKGP